MSLFKVSFLVSQVFIIKLAMPEGATNSTIDFFKFSQSAASNIDDQCCPLNTRFSKVGLGTIPHRSRRIYCNLPLPSMNRAVSQNDCPLANDGPRPFQGALVLWNCEILRTCRLVLKYMVAVSTTTSFPPPARSIRKTIRDTYERTTPNKKAPAPSDATAAAILTHLQPDLILIHHPQARTRELPELTSPSRHSE